MTTRHRSPVRELTRAERLARAYVFARETARAALDAGDQDGYAVLDRDARRFARALEGLAR